MNTGQRRHHRDRLVRRHPRRRRRQSPLVGALHLAEINADRLAEMRARPTRVSATTDWEEMVANPDIHALMVSTTPEAPHYPMAKAALEAGKHVLLEKPIAITLDEADELIALAEAQGPQVHHRLLAAVQRQAGAGQAQPRRRHARRPGQRAGQPPRHPLARRQDRHPHQAVAGRHGGDPRHRLRAVVPRAAPPGAGLLAEGLGRPPGHPRRRRHAVHHRHHGRRRRGRRSAPGMSLPPGLPELSTTWIEFIGTEGALLMDASHKDIMLNTMDKGVQFPLSTMPGEYVDHVYAGPMERETTALPRGGRLRPPGHGRPPPGPGDDGGLPRRRPVGRDPGGRPAAQPDQVDQASPTS